LTPPFLFGLVASLWFSFRISPSIALSSSPGVQAFNIKSFLFSTQNAFLPENIFNFPFLIVYSLVLQPQFAPPCHWNSPFSRDGGIHDLLWEKLVSSPRGAFRIVQEVFFFFPRVFRPSFRSFRLHTGEELPRYCSSISLSEKANLECDSKVPPLFFFFSF